MFIEPVFGKNFYGREDVLATLHKRVNAIKGGYRQNLALAGPMLTGKSSILRHFLKNVKDTDTIPIYVEMDVEGFDIFCTRFMATLLFQYLKVCGEKAEGDFPVIKEICRPKIPRTVAQVDEICKLVETKKIEEAYEKLLDLPSVLKSETQKNTIIILDEFHNLANFQLKKPFQTFGKFIMVQKDTMYIVSSSQKTLLKEILSRKLSLLFGNFELIEINGFDNHTSRSFIADKTKDMDIPDVIKNYIIQLSQGNPFYIETILRHIMTVSRGAGSSAVDKECLLGALAKSLYESDGILNQYFTNNINFFLEKKARKKFIPILLSLARGNAKVKSIQKDMGKKDSDLADTLEKLQYMDLIYKSGVFYKVQDKLFEFWLRNVYGLKANALVDDMDVKYIEFKNNVGYDFDGYCKFRTKSVPSALNELFSSFASEKVMIGTHERILPKFETIEERRSQEGVTKLICKSGDNKWLVYLKTSDISDDHDIAYLMNYRPSDAAKKITRRVIIPFKGMEHNAFLMAKEQNIWVWDVEQVNQLFRLFCKYELVI